MRIFVRKPSINSIFIIKGIIENNTETYWEEREDFVSKGAPRSSARVEGIE